MRERKRDRERRRERKRERERGGDVTGEYNQAADSYSL